jgi:hypothetical protein
MPAHRIRRLLPVLVSGLLLTCTLPLLAHAPDTDAQDDATPAAPRKPGAIVLQGCVSGGALTMITADEGQASPDIMPGASYRIAGPKSVVKQLKTQQNGRWVEVTGKVKGQFAPKGSGQRRDIGGVSVGIGLPTSDPNAPRVPEMPAFEVDSFRPLDTDCN